MSKDYKVYLEDILNAVEKIDGYVADMSYEDFLADSMASDAVIRNLAIIGEAAKKLPAHVKKERPEIDWRGIAGLRDIIVHKYSGVNLKVVWDIIKKELPELKSEVEEISRSAK